MYFKFLAVVLCICYLVDCTPDNDDLREVLEILRNLPKNQKSEVTHYIDNNGVLEKQMATSGNNYKKSPEIEVFYAPSGDLEVSFVNSDKPQEKTKGVFNYQFVQIDSNGKQSDGRNSETPYTLYSVPETQNLKDKSISSPPNGNYQSQNYNSKGYNRFYYNSPADREDEQRPPPPPPAQDSWQSRDENDYNRPPPHGPPGPPPRGPPHGPPPPGGGHHGPPPPPPPPHYGPPHHGPPPHGPPPHRPPPYGPPPPPPHHWPPPYGPPPPPPPPHHDPYDYGRPHYGPPHHRPPHYEPPHDRPSPGYSFSRPSNSQDSMKGEINDSLPARLPEFQENNDSKSKDKLYDTLVEIFGKPTEKTNDNTEKENKKRIPNNNAIPLKNDAVLEPNSSEETTHTPYLYQVMPVTPEE